MSTDHQTYRFHPEVRAWLEASRLAFGIFQVTDGEYAAILVSQGACSLFGMGHEDLVRYLTNKSYRLTHPEDAGKLLQVSKGFATHEELSIVIRMKIGGDGYRPILFYERPHIAADGTKLYVVTYFDISTVAENSKSVSTEVINQQRVQFFKDDVTGLPNVNYFQTFAPGTLKEHMDLGDIPTILLFDIHGMHFYNDRFGYEAGDKLLKDTADLIKEAFPGDFCVRYMEDHFVVITTREDAEEAASRVRIRLKEQTRQGKSFLDLNVGLYEYRTAGEKPSAAVDKARHAVDFINHRPDLFLCRYDDKVADRFERENYVISHYQDAIRNGWIKAYFQPLVSSKTGKVSHFEALARWIDPTYGFLSPADFIPILEQQHRLWELDLCVLELACKKLADLRDSGKKYAGISVNLSRYDLNVPDLHERIDEILARYRVPHDMIAIEITESALVNHEELISSHIEQFHEEGYQVWLDDFGSGYSSFNALQNFDFDLLKIDMQFLRHQNQRTPDILSMIVDLTRHLDIQSVTEGVETREQSDFLKKIGCGMLQGFYYSKPLNGDRVMEGLAEAGLEIDQEASHSIA